MIDVLKPLIQQFMPFAKEKMGFSRPPKLFLRQDSQNAGDPLGKTGFYDPEQESITIYISGRHPKDVLRSLAHELQHHTQKCNGDFDSVQNMGEQGYAQADPHMRSMEIEAYQASIVFRDWEDSLKETIYYEHLQKGDNSSMSTKKWKNRELNGLLMEKFGFEFKPLVENYPGSEEKEEEEEDPLAGPTVKAERTKRDSDDRTQGRKAGGRRLKPLEEYATEEEEEEDPLAGPTVKAEAAGDDKEEEEDPLAGPTTKRRDPAEHALSEELKVRRLVRAAIAKADKKNKR
mgnify:CR=1 FL=1